MMIVRPARHSDLSTVYNLQNVPFREKVFTLPLGPYESFKEEVAEKMKNREYYLYIFENDNVTIGFTEFSHTQEGWHVLSWGRSLYTLVYASSRIALEILRFPKLLAIIREENPRMLRVFHKVGIRLTWREHVLYYRRGIFSIGSTYLNHFEMLPEEYRGMIDFMRQHSYPLIFR
jgi:hypothetical protein